jgi:rhamnulose-1-phosphate aldolase
MLGPMRSTLSRVAGPYVEEIAAVAAEVARRGWAEANAGNLSVRVEAPEFTGAQTRLPSARRALAGRSLLVKRAGARMRDIARNPIAGLCLVRFAADGLSYRVLPADAEPSTELPSHLAVHDALIRHRPRDTAVLHTHPTATIAVSLLQSPRELVALLARMHSEGPLFIHGRVAAISFQPPGTEELAKATAAALRNASGVIWPCHGMVATGPGFAAALDIIEVVDKAAAVALSLGERKMLSAGLTFAKGSVRA